MLHSRLISVSGLIAIALAYSSPTAAAILASDIVVSPVAISGLVEGTDFTNGTVATFTDLNPGAVADYTATIHWGDGTTSAGTISAPAGSFTVTGSHTYAEEGSYSYSTDVTFLPSPGPFLAIGVNGNTVVADAALSLISTASPISFTPGILLSNLLLATFGDANPFGSVADFTGLIDWGDGTQTAGTISESLGQFSLEGSHTYASGGVYPVLIDISDFGGSSLRTRTTANSNSVPEPASLALLGLGLAGLGFSRRKKA